ncbi:fatty acid-binding protein, brain-like [Trichomycterus rosablanca]|uniref:fatty acid-binding protein, brain-like n=1 Tax=Trichomycterus rosablanca TaxID=2290929 RepID=UPI002F35F77B
MDVFVGCWKLVKQDNYDAYLKALGVGDKPRDVEKSATKVLKIQLEKDLVVINNRTNEEFSEIWFKLGEVFLHDTLHSRQCKTSYKLEGNKLVHTHQWDGKEAKIVYEIKDKSLISTLTFKDVKAVNTYEKI